MTLLIRLIFAIIVISYFQMTCFFFLFRVSVVAFDPYTSYSHCDTSDFSDDENTTHTEKGKVQTNTSSNDITAENIPINNKKIRRRSCREGLNAEKISTSYRLGSVGQDTQLCLWDITEDLLRQSYEKRHRRSSVDLQNDASHSLKEIRITKPTSDSDIVSNSKTNTFRSKCASSTTTSNDKTENSVGTTPNSTSVTISDSIKYSNSNSYSNNSKATNVSEKSTNAVSAKPESTSNNTTNEICLNKGNNGKSTESSLNPFNTLTQRFTHFNFANDKKTSSTSSNQQHSHKKPFIFSKTSGSNNCNNRNGHESEKNSKYLNNVISTYDPMKLIGSAACPRFEECPLLEPLVCKKIAHERLTALMFREDCFLTACQDGFIYTWARPGYCPVSKILR